MFANSIKDVSTGHFQKIHKAFQGLSEFITGAAIANGQTFPLVSVPQFEIQGTYARQTSGIEVLTFSPLVSEDQRVAWETFAWENQHWLDESRAFVLSNNQELLQTNNYFETPINEFLYQFSTDTEPRDLIPAFDPPFLPSWHVSFLLLPSSAKWIVVVPLLIFCFLPLVHMYMNHHQPLSTFTRPPLLHSFQDISITI
jgi:hypothetical protein